MHLNIWHLVDPEDAADFPEASILFFFNHFLAFRSIFKGLT